MRYNSVRARKCFVVYLTVYVVVLIGLMCVNAHFWDVHNENWDNINSGVNQKIIDENFARQHKILELEDFVIWKIIIPYTIIGIPLLLLSGFQKGNKNKLVVRNG